MFRIPDKSTCTGKTFAIRMACRGTAVIFLLAMVLLGGCQRESPCLRQVNNNGFGDFWNHYAWAMATFGPHLYVGTMNVELWAGQGVAVAEADRVISKGTEIWRYDGESWEQVVDNGFKGAPENLGTRNLFVYDGMLYAGTVNYTEGCEMWRTGDGTSWEQVMQGGFGKQSTGSVRGMAEYGGLLYVGVENIREGGELYAWDGTSWTQIADRGIDNPLNISMADLVPWNDLLYVFTWNPLGFEAYSFDGIQFERLIGFGAPKPPGLGQLTNMAVLGTSVYRDRFYLGTANFLFGADLFRSDDGQEWEQLVDNGFDDPRQAYIWRMKPYRGDLYMGTWTEGHLPLPFREGGRLYRLDPEENIEELVGPGGLLMDAGFGDGQNYGIRTMTVFQEKLFLGTGQCFFCACRKGTEIWELDPDAPGCDLETTD
jgi:hypothetical protein